MYWLAAKRLRRAGGQGGVDGSGLLSHFFQLVPLFSFCSSAAAHQMWQDAVCDCWQARSFEESEVLSPGFDGQQEGSGIESSEGLTKGKLKNLKEGACSPFGVALQRGGSIFQVHSRLMPIHRFTLHSLGLFLSLFPEWTKIQGAVASTSWAVPLRLPTFWQPGLPGLEEHVTILFL